MRTDLSQGYRRELPMVKSEFTGKMVPNAGPSGPLTGRALKAQRDLEQVRAKIEAQEARTLDPQSLKLSPQKAAQLLNVIRTYGADSFERALKKVAVKVGGAKGGRR